MDDLLQEFIAETRETLEALSGEIVGWERDPTDRARLDAIFRFVHTIKGSCGFLDLPRLARLSHAAEDVLSAVRAGERQPDAATVSAILAIIDRIGELVEAINSGESLDDGDEAGLIAMLERGAEPAAAIAPAEAAPAHAFTAPASAAPASRGAKRSVRLSVDLLDRMMSGVSDMVLARNQVARQLRDTGDPQLEATLERLSMTVAELRDTVTRTRMQRIDALFQSLPRMARDTAAAVGKSVSLEIEGGDVELDREMIEMLRDPLAHMVRNAIDHGIEARADRVFAGKPAQGTLRIAARQAGNLIVIEIVDDGQGIDVDRLVEKVLRARPDRAAEINGWSEARKLDLIFEAGLSTRDEASEISGRGVGMDVVKANVEQIGGRIALKNTRGRGLAVTIEVPLTLAILNAVIVEAAGTRFALSRQVVEEIVAVDARTSGALRIERFGANAMAVVRGRRMPMIDLPTLLGLHVPETVAMVAIVTLREGVFALALSGVVETQELVVKPAAPAVMSTGIYAGQMLPDDGVPILLLDVAGIAQRAGLQFERREMRHEEEAAVEAPRALLFRDTDGCRRMIAAEAVSRIERVAPGAVTRAGDHWWVTREAAAVPLWIGRVDDPSRVGTILRLQLDGRELGYPVVEACEIVDLPADPVEGPEGTTVVMLGDEPTELLDILALFDGEVRPASRPLCLLHGSESGWMEAFLRPTIEAAGYQVVRQAQPGTTITVALAMEEEASGAPGRVICLSRRAGAGIYRGDRAALVAALQEYRA
ncbi:Hpt domain-containing protein [Sphingomonas sp. RHCKR47]|uniref:chemotaxis protein CheA n=1 Tax=Sphingomonas citricola TaxID=2862498 RepID=UPI001CA5A5AA|nr:Hpt domain-containing protein [Sphingomonas citricola]MBW6522321.1 Hpt domain-containing protein [Sphingomonas citricola]